MTTPKLIAFAGSTRTGSLNRSLLLAASGFAKQAGLEIIDIDLAGYPLPLFNQDLEATEGLPENVVKLKALFREADGFIIASPEYNSAFTPLLKNTIDWCSRAESEDEPPLAAYAGKFALLLSASPGPLGGLRGLYTVRELCQNIGITIFPEMLSMRSAHEVICEDGSITNEKWNAKIEAIVGDFAGFAKLLV